MKPKKIREKDIQRLILDYLTLKGIFHFRNNTGGFMDKNKRFYRFGALGSPDIICVVKGNFVGIEVKNKGKQSEAQKKFQKNLEKAGGKYVLAYSLEDVEDEFKKIKV